MGIRGTRRDGLHTLVTLALREQRSEVVHRPTERLLQQRIVSSQGYAEVCLLSAVIISIGNSIYSKVPTYLRFGSVELSVDVGP